MPDDAPLYIQPDRDIFRQWVESAATTQPVLDQQSIPPTVDFLHFMAGCIAHAANAGRLTIPRKPNNKKA